MYSKEKPRSCGAGEHRQRSFTGRGEIYKQRKQDRCGNSNNGQNNRMYFQMPEDKHNKGANPVKDRGTGKV